MHVCDARRLCPELIIVPCQYDKYFEISKKLYQIIIEYSNIIEAVSADEAYIEISEGGWDSVKSVIESLREKIFIKTGLVILKDSQFINK